MHFPRRPAWAGVLFVLLLAPAGQVLADTATDAAQRLARLRQQQAGLTVELASAETSLARAAAGADERRRELEAAREVQVGLQERLADARAELRAQETRLADRVRELYMSGEQAPVVFLLSLESLEGLDTALEYLSNAARVDAGLLDGLRSQRAEVERLEVEASAVVEEAERAAAASQAAYEQSRAKTQDLRGELEVLDRRVANLEEAWADHRMGLARGLVAEMAPSAGLEEATLAQARLRASLPLGPADGVPPGWTTGGPVMEGIASWYGPGFHGRRTASGAVYDERDFTVAHRTLPHETLLLVTYGSRQVIVMVNDRGPYVAGRDFDLSRAAAEYLGLGLGTISAQEIVPGSGGG